MTDSESSMYGQMFASFLNDVGLSAEKRQRMIFGKLQAGFQITTGKNRADDAALLLKIMKDTGLMEKWKQVSTSNTPDELELFVGPKH